MADTKTVMLGGDEVELTRNDDGSVSADVVEEVEAVLVSSSGSEVHISDLDVVDIRHNGNGSNPFQAFFNDEDRHSESPKTGNPEAGEYDRNWYFTELRSE